MLTEQTANKQVLSEHSARSPRTGGAMSGVDGATPSATPASPSPEDQRKLTEVYRQYGHLVVRICREVLRQQQDAEDAMHETFLKFWRYSDRLQEPREVVAMLRRIALSTAIDLLRARQRQGRYGEAWRDLREVMHAEKLDESESRRHARQLVSMLLQAVRVDRDTIEMTYLYYMDEKTLEEVAELTGYSRRSVGMKLQRFRENAAKYCNMHGIKWES